NRYDGALNQDIRWTATAGMMPARSPPLLATNAMSSPRETILQALRDITLIDPHTHINPYNPASQTLADLLGYHYYTELAHSAGMPKDQIESPGLGPRELVELLVGCLGHLSNTVQSSWLVDL